jgi:hypothetical protein
MDFEKKLNESRAFNEKVLKGEHVGYGLPQAHKKDQVEKYMDVRNLFT